MKRTLRKLFTLWNLFPCPVCRSGDGQGGNRFCKECEKRMFPVTGERCRGCSGELDTALALCSACMQEESRPWQGALAVYEYRDRTRQLVNRFKFYNHPELARSFGLLAAERMKEIDYFKADAVIPVPLHITRYYWRSFNQAELFGEIVAGELGIPLLNALKRVKRTRHQAKLGKKERRRNPRGIFAVKSPEAIRGKCILLVDDVFTTGATLAEAANTLLRAGSGPVFILTAAKTPRY